MGDIVKIVGLIVEYNPLHTGHVYHFNKVKELSNADLIIAVMSSSFTMRGEVSVFNKFIKTKQALQMGVDIIIELPFVYTVNNANFFADYSVKLLSYIGVNEIWIGSENNDNSLYKKYYDVLRSEKYNTLIKDYLKQGLSYKTASNNSFIECNLNELSSNDTLGLSYYESICNNNLNISLYTIKREGNNYLDDTLTNTYSSAKAIRNKKDNFTTFLPSYVLNDFNQFNFLETSRIFNYLKYKIINTSIIDLKNIFLMDEGFENKLKSITNYLNFESFFNSLKTKRYTDSRIRRMLLYVLFNITKKDIEEIRNENVNFIRILGFKESAREYLNKIKKNITIYTNIKDGINKVLDIELRISKTLDLIYNLNLFEQEQKRPIILK